MLNMGRTLIFKTNVDRKCAFCEQTIEKATIYIRQVGNRKKFFFTDFYHIQCFYAKIDKKVDEWKSINYDKRTARPEGVRDRPRRATLTPEQINRRQALLMYLNTRGRDSLIKAYKQQSTVRVCITMSNMYKWLMELDSMGSDFPKAFMKGELNDLITTYDRDWWSTTVNQPEGPKRWERFVRDINSKYLPEWPKVEAEVDE